MSRLTTDEAAAVAFVATQPMLAQVERWSAANSGTHNLGGLAQIAAMLLADFATLPGTTALVDGERAEQVAARGHVSMLDHGRTCISASGPRPRCSCC